MRRALLAATILFNAHAYGAETPSPCGPDPRERCIPYQQGQIVRVFAAPGATLTVEFPATEKVFFTGVSDNQLLSGGNASERVSTGQDSTGDPNLMIWVPGAPDAPQQFMTIKPLHQLEPQPLLVLTWWTDPVSGQRSIRRHSFELRTRKGDLTENVPDTFFSVRFLDPAGDRAVQNARGQAAREARQAKIAGARLQQASLNAPKRNAAYDGQGTEADKVLSPSQIWDDGERTYLRYPGNRRPPMIYQVLPDGKEDVVGQSTVDDPTTHGNILIVQTVAALFRLRDGDNVLCIINRGYDPVGTNGGTGTVDPGVVRELRKADNGR
jgi:type IV secretion system protein VirB9